MMHATQLLATAMGYPIKIPTAPITRSVRMMFADKVAKEPHLEKRKFAQRRHRIAPQENGLGVSETKILKLMDKHKEVTGVSMATITGYTSNHCGMLLGSLFKKGLLRRRQEKGNHCRWYVYMKKEGV